jgi:hypothetical protein
MAATVEVRVLHGGSPALGGDITGRTARFKLADDDAQDAAAPIDRPAAGVTFSWRKSFLLVATSLPDGFLSNLRFFSDGAAIGTGQRVLLAESVSYIQATSADAEEAISAVDVDAFTSNIPKIIQAGNFVDGANDIAPYAGGGLQAHVMLQLEVASSAVGGDGGSKTLTYRYDES